MPDSIPVLMYHHVCNTPGPHTISPENFRSQLVWLRDHDYQTLTASEFQQWRSGTYKLDGPAVMLTFDDGWLDNWIIASPLLEEFSCKATLFLVTGWPGEGPVRSALPYPDVGHTSAMESIQSGERDAFILRWSEINELEQDNQFEIQCHSHSHGEWWNTAYSQGRFLKEIEQDLVSSKQTFLKQLSRFPDKLCWPFGRFTWSMARLAGNLGFTQQYTTIRGSNSPLPYSLVRRIPAQNRDAQWLGQILHFYDGGFRDTGAGAVHQAVTGIRLLKKYRQQIRFNDAPVLGWR